MRIRKSCFLDIVIGYLVPFCLTSLHKTPRTGRYLIDVL